MPFVALDTRLGWNFVAGTFVPPRKAVAGKFIDRGRSLSISARYQGSLTSAAVAKSFKFDVGVGLLHSIDASSRPVSKEAAKKDLPQRNLEIDSLAISDQQESGVQDDPAPRRFRGIQERLLDRRHEVTS